MKRPMSDQEKISLEEVLDHLTEDYVEYQEILKKGKKDDGHIGHAITILWGYLGKGPLEEWEEFYEEEEGEDYLEADEF